MTSPTRYFIGLCIAICALVLATDAKADKRALAIVNALRTTECPDRHAAINTLKSNRKLDKAAQFVQERFKTRDALKRADYLADQSATIHLSGTLDDASLRRVLRKNHCGTLTDSGLAEVGFSRSANEIAIVFAAPFAPPPTRDANKVAQEVLQLVNAARAKTRKCGRKSFAAVPSLTLNPTLGVAALAHAKDMAAHRQMSHEGSDGSGPDERATRAGYAWKAVGENVAMGQLNARQVVDGWLSSPHHCENIMDPDFTHMAVAYATVGKNETGIYWAQVLGKPK